MGWEVAVVRFRPHVRRGVQGQGSTPCRRRFVRLKTLVARARDHRASTAAVGGAGQRIRPRLTVAALALVVVPVVTLTLVVPRAAADSLTDRRAQLTQALARSQSDLSESSGALAAAGAALGAAEGQLEMARAELARTQDELAAARARDVAMAAKLKKSRAELAEARAAVKAGQRALDAKKRLAGVIVRDQYQQQTNLLPIALLLENSSTSDLHTRLQWSTTLFDTTGAVIAELKALQVALEAEKARQAVLEEQIAADRLQAARNLQVRKDLAARAAVQEASVASLVQQQQAVEASAAGEVAADRAQYAELTKERASVEQRIAARVARAKARAARAAAAQRAERRAQQAAAEAAARRAADRAAAQARKAAAQARKAAAEARRAPVSRSSSKSSAPAPSRQRPAGSSSSGSSSSGSTSAGSSRPNASPPAPASTSNGFSYPVSAPITSPFGNRFHPVLHIWKLHDGTDFGAGCGQEIRAPYAGRVAERYYNGGYGNRLMIDHGLVQGRYVTTGYNHAIRYTVGVGQHVSRGQVIGYVGTTGYSTGCHLHLMVWLDGGLANPMTWF